MEVPDRILILQVRKMPQINRTNFDLSLPRIGIFTRWFLFFLLGIEVIRRHVADYIEKRDGGIKSDWQNVILCAGASEGIR